MHTTKSIKRYGLFSFLVLIFIVSSCEVMRMFIYVPDPNRTYTHTQSDFDLEYKPDSCRNRIDFCDTCISYEDVRKWEEERGSIELYLDKRLMRLSLKRKFLPDPGPSSKDYLGNNLHFFFQDSNSMFKHLIEYKFTSNYFTDDRIEAVFLFSVNIKVFFDSFYFNKVLNNRYEGILNRDSAIVNHWFQGNEFDSIYYEELMDYSICMGYYLSSKYGDFPLEYYRTHRRGAVTNKYDDYHRFPESFMDALITISNKTPIDSNQRLDWFLSSANISEYNVYNEENSNTYKKRNIALYIFMPFKRTAEFDQRIIARLKKE